MSYSSEQLEDIDYYYKLKKQYKKSQDNSISKIMSNDNLTIADKEFELKVMNKCINCKSDGGTVFEETSSYLKAYCGANTKCDFTINVEKGDQRILLPDLLEKLRLSLEDKNQLIQLKIKHAIGSIDDNDALNNLSCKRASPKITACASIKEKAYFSK